MWKEPRACWQGDPEAVGAGGPLPEHRFFDVVLDCGDRGALACLKVWARSAWSIAQDLALAGKHRGIAKFEIYDPETEGRRKVYLNPAHVVMVGSITEPRKAQIYPGPDIPIVPAWGATGMNGRARRHD